MACNYKEFFLLYFSELKRRGIPYVILHSYQEYPGKIASDIDYCVPHEHLPKLHLILAELAQKNDWALVQTLQHGVFAYYSVVVNLADPAQNLRLDACSSYARARRYFVPENIFLANPIEVCGFNVPSPAGEFAYVVAKMFDAKKRSPAKYLARLKELWSLDKSGAEKNFAALFGNTGKSLAQWFESPPDDWRPLGPIMYARKKFGPVLMVREMMRVVKRILNPTGVCLAILGLEEPARGALTARLGELLQPCFRYQPLRFKPRGFRQPSTGAASDADQRERLSRAKTIPFFFNYLAAWWRVVLPARISSHLVICEDSFDELFVEKGRNGLHKADGFVRFLQKILPRPDRTFVLLTPPWLSVQHQPGSSLEEWEWRQKILLQLANGGRHHTTISAEGSPEELARHVWREVVEGMAAREARRA